MTELCLTMIVRSEAARIERCLKSVAPYIRSYSITDTGSTDGTPAIIKQFFDDQNIGGSIHSAPFINFEQARNESLIYARNGGHECDYLLLVDADMELVVTDPKAFEVDGPCYTMLQKSGGLSYQNRRLLRIDQIGKYRGVTHEFLDVAATGSIQGAYFIDHADGSNRKDKFVRDIKLLEEGLKAEPNNARYQFYLAQSYRDSGDFKRASEAYAKRVRMGGWDEEVWNAQYNYANCLKAFENVSGFLVEMLKAYQIRPSRAEPLYELAKYYREQGMNAASLLYSTTGLVIPYPSDQLFVSDFVYQYGLREEFSICAFYDARHRTNGLKATNALALDKSAPTQTREIARMNLGHYLKPLSSWCPSFQARMISCQPPVGFSPMNPSVAIFEGRIYTTVRMVNYKIEENRYLIDGQQDPSRPIVTRNFLLQLNDTLETIAEYEITQPNDQPEPLFKQVIGWEDMRLFVAGDELWVSANVREMNDAGICEQWIARINPVCHTLESARKISNSPNHEKNWMPHVVRGLPMPDIRFIYRLGKSLNFFGLTISDNPPPIASESISGGSQLIQWFSDYLCIVHEARIQPNSKKRYYLHRFAILNGEGALLRLGMPWFLHRRDIEFVAGMAWHPDGKRLIISYGDNDASAWVGTIEAGEVNATFT